MSDSEKLDKQRLKNFKNKGRDLEVKSFTRAAVTSINFTANSQNNPTYIHTRRRYDLSPLGFLAKTC